MALIGVSILLAVLSLFVCRNKGAQILARLLPPIPARSERQPTHQPSASEGKPDNAETEREGAPDHFSDNSSESSSDLSGPTIELEPPPIMADDDDSPASSSASKPQAQSKSTIDAVLMPPPPPPPLKTKPSPSASTLRIPSNGPLPNRGPPPKQPQTATSLTVSNAATASTLPPLSRPRKKVILPPGHSPLDWAQKTRTTAPQQLSGVPWPQRITPSQLAWATGRKGKPAWAAYKGRVYNITPYLKFHPGGEAELMRAAGRDAQPLFDEVHAWVNWENMLGACLVGFLVQEGENSS